MSKKFWALMSLILVLSMILAACGSAATTEAPVPTDEPAPTEAPEAVGFCNQPENAGKTFALDSVEPMGW